MAAALRGLTSNVHELRKSYESEGFSILCNDQADYYQICMAVCGYLPPEHMHPCDYAELHARLADLIEPSEPKVKCVAEVKVDGERLEKLAHDAAVELTGIDRDALLALADEMEADADRVIKAAKNARFGGGPRMGEAKHEASEWRSIARRIREALGVAS